MSNYSNVPDTIVRQLASKAEIKTRGREIEEIISDLKNKGEEDKLSQLDQEYRFAGQPTGLTICKPDAGLPDKSKTADDFIDMLVEEGHIHRGQVGNQWQPSLRREIQICSLVQDGSDVFIKLVEAKKSSQKSGYATRPSEYAHFTSVVIHFGQELIELRCAHSSRDHYTDYVMKLMGFAAPYKWHSWTTVTKTQAKQISQLMKAKLVSTEIALPVSVGSVRFNADKSTGTDLRNDAVLSAIFGKIDELEIPTSDTNDEVCEFEFTCPVSSLTMLIAFEINIRQGGFKFTKAVTESAINHVIDAFAKVISSAPPTLEAIAPAAE